MAYICGSLTRNSGQAVADGLVAVDGVMATGTKRDQIPRMRIELVAIYMMTVEVWAPMNALFVAELAGPLVAIFDELADGFPVWRVGPISNATVPRGVVLPGDGSR